MPYQLGERPSITPSTGLEPIRLFGPRFSRPLQYQFCTKMAKTRAMGFEPMYTRVKVWCVYHFTTPQENRHDRIRTCIARFWRPLHNQSCSTPMCDSLPDSNASCGVKVRFANKHCTLLVPHCFSKALSFSVWTPPRTHQLVATQPNAV